jgi:hypothetical protein
MSQSSQKLKLPIFELFYTFFLITIAFCSIVDEPSSILEMQESGPAKSVATAMTEVIQKFFIDNFIDFDFIIYGQTTSYIDDVIDGITRNLSENTTVNIKHITDIDNWNHEMSRSAVILMKTREYLWNLHAVGTNFSYGTKLSNSVPKTLKFLIHVEKIDEFQQLIDVTNDFRMPYSLNYMNFKFFELFIINDQNQSMISLAANVLFSKNNCRQFQLKMLNIFDTDTQKWEFEVKNFDHFDDLNGCMINLMVGLDHLLFSDEFRGLIRFVGHEVDIPKLMRAVASENFKFQGLTNELVQLMAQRANFSVHFFFSTDKADTTEIIFFKTRNFMPKFGALIMFPHGFIEMRKKFFCSEPFASMDSYYLVSHNDLYTNYEKLTMPFDEVTWMLLLTTFGFTFGIILGLHLCPQFVRNAVFGAGELN